MSGLQAAAQGRGTPWAPQVRCPRMPEPVSEGVPELSSALAGETYSA